MVRIYGIRLHLWCDENFQKIGKEIGENFEISNDLESFKNLNMKVLVENGKNNIDSILWKDKGEDSKCSWIIRFVGLMKTTL